ncbi:MAG: glycosyltransferase family 2 protein [Pseudomonadota bacterium]
MPDRAPTSKTTPNTPARLAPKLGVAIATFRSEATIEACLDSLWAARADIARVVITDNASEDATVGVIRAWAERHDLGSAFAEIAPGDAPPLESWLVLARSPVNAGFAHATNRSIEALLADNAIEMVWLLNPDCRIAPDAARIYREVGAGQDFALMGGRTAYDGAGGDTIQTDGGRVSRWTGVCQSVNLGQLVATAPMPAAASLDFITGANCVASRRFVERAGLMPEDYFLYYEEVDWAYRRGGLPLITAPEALVWHLGGASIGSGLVGRRASPFANYFNAKSRLRFVRRHHPAATPFALVHAVAKAAQLALIGRGSEARALFAGAFGRPPPAEVAQILSPEAQAIAFAPRS